MGVLKVRNASINEGSSRCPAEEPALKDLDDSHRTISTHDSDADVNDENQGTRPPIVICEDDAYHTDEHTNETHFHTSLIRDSIQVQMHHNITDDALHEENPHLEDYYLIPDHSVHIERPDETDDVTVSGEETNTKKDCCTQEAADKEAATKKKCCARGVLRSESRISEPQEKPSHQRKRSISFGTVLVRDYDMTLGDHPCCGYGPPLTIDWNYLEYEPIDMNEYEFHHPPRRTTREMGFNYYQRKRLLSDAGFTEEDFKLTKKELNRAKLNRSITRQVVSYPPLLKVETAVESACRKFKRLIKEDHWKQQKSLYAVSA
mmetsp:Transcript_34342/g.60334  ORF Transcript_34342/g.60334 Transcript_34342/m.60334 type:complete len:319 (-) Transcript_34342:70-1026(-)